MDRDRFRKAAMYSERKMRGHLSAKDEILGTLADEAMSASYLRRKPRQGKAGFDQGLEDEQK